MPSMIWGYLVLTRRKHIQALPQSYLGKVVLALSMAGIMH
jgi:hypothetical protein